jgi:hypothetical protein
MTFPIHETETPSLESYQQGLAVLRASAGKAVGHTYALQARPFYEKLGFEVFAKMDGPEPFYPRWFMRKALA